MLWLFFASWRPCRNVGHVARVAGYVTRRHVGLRPAEHREHLLPRGGLPQRVRAGDVAAILATAARELQEEAGYALAPEGRWEQLGYFFTSAAFTDEHSHLVAALGVLVTLPAAGQPPRPAPRAG